MLEINPTYHTACKGCLFSIWKGNSVRRVPIKPDTQAGCYLEKIKEYKKNDIEIIEAYDEEEEFFVINGYKCLWFRNQEWQQNLNLAEQYPDPDDLYDIARKEIAMKCHIIIVATSNFEDLLGTLDSVYIQTLQPVFITIIKPTKVWLDIPTLISYLKLRNIQWQVKELIDSNITVEQSIDEAIAKMSVPYYSVYTAGCILPSNALQDISDYLIDNVHGFVALLSHNGNGFTTSRLVHRLANGNKDELLELKLQKETICLPRLFPIQEIVQNFPV